MILSIRLFFLSLLIFLVIPISSCKKKEPAKETVARQLHKHPYAIKKSYAFDIHGITLHDEYHWMEDNENPEVFAYLEEENKYVDSMMQYSNDLQQIIYNELVARSSSEEAFLKKIESHEYLSIREKDQLYPVYYKKSPGSKDKKETIIDFNNILPEEGNFSITSFEISPDQQHYAFAIKQGQEKEFSLIIKNIKNNSISDTIPGVSNFIIWAEDSQTIFYTTQDETGRNDKVFNHKIYLPYEDDKLEFYEEDNQFNVSIHKSKNNKYIIIQSESSTSSETHYLTADDPNQNFMLFSPRVNGRKYQIFPHINTFYIIDKEINTSESKLMKAAEGATDAKNWQLAEIFNRNHSIDDIDIFENYLVVYKSENGSQFIDIKDFNKNTTEQILFEESTYLVIPDISTSFHDEEFRYRYESLLVPPSIFLVDLKTRKNKNIQGKEVLDFNKDSYITERINVIAEDGVQIPVSLVYQKGIKRDGTAPLYLFGYGAFGENSFPNRHSSLNFSNRVSLLKRGYIVAIAHVRGSGDLGAIWHEKGKGMQKKNAINDYIKCAKYLIEKGYTGSDKIVAFGEGFGAVLACSAVNAQPDLFEIIILKNPKTDLLQKGKIENEDFLILKDEFGDTEDEEEFNFMLTYSPYDNIEVKAYPDFFIYAEFYNNAIPFYESAKWAARLREYNTGNNTLLFKTNFNYPSTISSQLKDAALEYAFVLEKLGDNQLKKPLAEKKF